MTDWEMMRLKMKVETLETQMREMRTQMDRMKADREQGEVA